MLRKIPILAVTLIGTALIWSACDLLTPGQGTPSPSPSASPSPSPGVSSNAGVAQRAVSTASGSGVTSFNAIATDGSGNQYVVGDIYYNTPAADFGNGVQVQGINLSFSMLIVKYNAAGVAQWGKTVVSSPNASHFFGVATDSSGNVYAVGYFLGNGAIDFGNGVSASNAPYAGVKAVIVKYNSGGVPQWAKTIAVANGETYFLSIAVDSSDNIYAAGFLSGVDTYDCGNGVTLTGINGADVLLVKYNTSGQAQWAKTIVSGSDGSEFYKVATDSSNNVYAAGYVTGTGAFDFGTSASATGVYDGYNPLVVKYSSGGMTQWARTITGGNDAVFTGIAVDPSGDIAVVGTTNGPAGQFSFDPGVSVTTTADVSALLVKYNAAGTAQWAKTALNGTRSNGFNDVVADSLGNFYVAGYIHTDSTAFDFGNGITANSSYSGDNLVLVKYNTSGAAQWAKTTVSASGDSKAAAISAHGSSTLFVAGSLSGTGTVALGNNVTVNGGAAGSSASVIRYE